MEITTDLIKTVLNALGKNTEDTKVEDTKVEDTKVEDTKVEDTKVEDTKVEDTKVEDTKVEDTKVDINLIEKLVKNTVDSKLKELEEKNDFYRTCSEAGLDSKSTKIAEDVIFNNDFKQIVELLSNINKTIPNSVISNTDKVEAKNKKINTPGIY
jgi:hypothetical protein